MKIIESYGDCRSCELINNDSGEIETNCKSDLREVYTLIVLDKPEFYVTKYIKFIKENTDKYLITYSILCKNGNDNYKKCKNNTIELLKYCDPSEVFTIGEISKKLINSLVVDSKIKVVNYENIDVWENSLKKDDSIIKENKNVFKFKIPDKYYTDEYRLVDIQCMYHHDNKVIYIFRDKNNKKEFYEYPNKEKNYYWFEPIDRSCSKILESYNNLKLTFGNYNKRSKSIKSYESDVKMDAKHAIDYYIQNQKEAEFIQQNVLYLDIEIYTFDDKKFPRPDLAEHPINCISFKVDNGTVYTYLLVIEGELDLKIYDILKKEKFKNVVIFNNEIEMIKAFINNMLKLESDFVCGWNSNHFDMPYLSNRLKNFGENIFPWSPFGNVSIDMKYHQSIITGFVVLDQLDLYKNFTQNQESSYQLDAIAKTLLDKGKEEVEENLNWMYSDDIESFLKYSIQDVDLLYEINDKVKHIELQCLLRESATTSHNSAQTTTGLIDNLFLYNLKKKGLAARNADVKNSNENDKLIGAYVLPVVPGLREGVIVDFDFTALYPSCIASYNMGVNTFFGQINNEDAIFDLIYNRDKFMEYGKIKFIKNPLQTKKEIELTPKEILKLVEENEATLNISGSLFKGHNIERSNFSEIIMDLFQKRELYKKIMFETKDKNKKDMYNGYQWSVKILMNSLYGVLALKSFRFFDMKIANAITAASRELLKISKVGLDNYLETNGSNKTLDKKFLDKVENKSNFILAGDTDSIFIDLTEYIKNKGIKI